MTTAGDADSTTSETRVAEVLERVRAGVRQRRAELATLGEQSEELRLRLAELKTREFVEEPAAVSPRPVVGPLLVFLKKAGFHLFVKWWARPVLQQQNAYNHLASSLTQDLAGSIQDLQRRLETLAGRLEALTETVEGVAEGGREDLGSRRG